MFPFPFEGLRLVHDEKVFDARNKPASMQNWLATHCELCGCLCSETCSCAFVAGCTF
jgi:hypothetical protein